MRLLMANTGYWMPFEAAKAIAATFCWKIRYALTPVFGPDFPTMCIRPECERFGNMIIDPAITQRCTEEATFYRQLEVQTTTRARSRTRTPLTPASPSMPRPVKQLRRKAHHLVGAGSGYTSDSSFEDNYSASSLSPTIPYCNTWTPANTPRSVGPLLHTRVASRPDTPAAIPAATPAEAPEAEDAEVNSTDSASMSSTTSLLLKSGPDARDDDADEEYDNCDGASSDSSSVAVSKLYETRAKKPDFPSLSDKKAAYLLLKLSMEASLTETPRVAKRRASA